MKRILVTGANGMTGSELCAQAAAVGWTVRAMSHADTDITDARSDLVKARTQMVKKLVDYNAQLALLESLTGEPVAR